METANDRAVRERRRRETRASRHAAQSSYLPLWVKSVGVPP
jgi:hypothetical protein